MSEPLKRPTHYILDGTMVVPEPDQAKWQDWFNKNKNVVARSQVGEARIETIFLGFDQNVLANDREPLLFETLVIGGSAHGSSAHYSSFQEALVGHKRIEEAERRLTSRGGKATKVVRTNRGSR